MAVPPALARPCPRQRQSAEHGLPCPQLVPVNLAVVSAARPGTSLLPRTHVRRQRCGCYALQRPALSRFGTEGAYL